MTDITATQILRSELTAAARFFENDDYAEIVLGERRLAMGTEWDTVEAEDGETTSVVWGWTWTTYLADVDAPGGWEEMSTDSTQDAETARAAVAAWIAQA